MNLEMDSIYQANKTCDKETFLLNEISALKTKHNSEKSRLVSKLKQVVQRYQTLQTDLKTKCTENNELAAKLKLSNEDKTGGNGTEINKFRSKQSALKEKLVQVVQKYKEATEQLSLEKEKSSKIEKEMSDQLSRLEKQLESQEIQLENATQINLEHQLMKGRLADVQQALSTAERALRQSRSRLNTERTKGTKLQERLRKENLRSLEVTRNEFMIEISSLKKDYTSELAERYENEKKAKQMENEIFTDYAVKSASMESKMKREIDMAATYRVRLEAFEGKERRYKSEIAKSREIERHLNNKLRATTVAVSLKKRDYSGDIVALQNELKVVKEQLRLKNDLLKNQSSTMSNQKKNVQENNTNLKEEKINRLEEELVEARKTIGLGQSMVAQLSYELSKERENKSKWIVGGLW
eukprot:g6021.t1